MGFIWLLLKMLFLMLLSAIGGYLLRKWLERSYYKDVTVSYSEALAKHEAGKKEYDTLKSQYMSLQNNVDSKLDGVLGRFSPIEDKLKNADMSADLAEVAQQIGAVQNQIASMPKPKDTDLSPVLGAISGIKMPVPEKPNFAPVMDAISSIRIPEAKTTDLSPVLQAIDKIRIPEPEKPNLTPVLSAIENIRIPDPQKTDLSPVLSAIDKIRIPEPEKTNLSPVLEAVRGIRIPERKEVNTLPLMTAIRNIKIPKQKDPDLSPLLAEIKSLKAELKKRPAVQKTVVKPAPEPVVKPVSSQNNKSVIANRLGSRGNRLRSAAFGKPDDLKVISGVGPKLEKMLHGIGVYYYWQVSDWTKADVQEADDLLDAFKGRIDRDNWVSQAGKLAKTPTASKRP